MKAIFTVHNLSSYFNVWPHVIAWALVFGLSLTRVPRPRPCSQPHTVWSWLWPLFSGFINKSDVEYVKENETTMNIKLQFDW